MAHVLTLPGVKGMFAVGLSWRHEETVPKANTLRALSADMGKWGAVYQASGGGVQVGFCEPIDGLRKPGKARSLAAAVADEFTQPWRGIFEVEPGLFWYVAVRDGQEILNDGDLVGTQDDVLRVWAEHDRLSGWKTELTDKPLDLIADAIKAKSKVPRLRDLSYNPTTLYIGAGAVGAVLLAAVGVGMYIHSKHEEDIAQRQLFAARAAAAAAAATANARAAIVPWSALPLAQDVFTQCQAQWDQQAIGVKGWALIDWSCSVDAAGVTIGTKWKRNGGVANDAPGNLDDGGETSTREIVVPATYADLNQDALTGEAAPRAMYTVAQKYGLKMQLDKSVVLVPKETPDAPTVTAPKPWLPLPMSMELRAPPWLQVGAAPFDDVIGLRIASVEYDYDKQLWITKGTLYEMIDTRPALDTEASDAAAAPSTAPGSAAAVTPGATPASIPASSAVSAAGAAPVSSGHAMSDAKGPVVSSTAAAGAPVPPAAVAPAPMAPLNPVASADSAASASNSNPNESMGALALVQARRHNAGAATASAAAATPRPSTIPPGVGN